MLIRVIIKVVFNFVINQEGNMSKRILGIVILIILLLLLGGAGYISLQNSYGRQEQVEIIEADRYFKIIDIGDSNYQYIIYNKEKEVVRKAEHYGSIPIITYIDQDMIQILLLAGSDTFFCRYYDIDNDRFSESFESPITTKYKRIVYYNYQKEPYGVVVSDIFDKELFYQEYELDLALAVAPVNKAEFLDENTLAIEYMSGSQYEIKSVVLDLKHY